MQAQHEKQDVAVSGENNLALYIRDMTARLELRREERLLFLSQAANALSDLLEAARLLDDDESCREIQYRLDDIRQQQEQIANLPVLKRPDGSADISKREHVEANGRKKVSLTDVGSISSQAAESAMDPDMEGGQAAERSLLDEPPSAHLDEPVADAPRAVDPPPPAMPVPPAQFRWKPRPAEEVYAEMEAIREGLLQGFPPSDEGLLRFKSAMCRQRMAYVELEALELARDQASAIYSEGKQIAQDLFGSQYILPLDTNNVPLRPPAWIRLSQAYEAMALGMQVAGWCFEQIDHLRPQELQSLLDGAAATQQLVYRIITDDFSGMDVQQRNMYDRLRRFAAEERVYLRSLSADESDDALGARCSALRGQYSAIRGSHEKRICQKEARDRLLALTQEHDFGIRAEDSESLCRAVHACLESGMPASNRVIRDAVIPYAGLLVDPELHSVVAEVNKELERQEIRDAAVEVEDDGQIFSPEIQGLLDELRRETRGRSMLFIGGVPQEERRRLIEQTLELAKLTWPESSKTAGVSQFDSLIANSDIAALLIRWMRTGFGQASETCDRYGKRLVRIPRGMGLTRIITDLHQQLVPRT